MFHVRYFFAAHDLPEVLSIVGHCPPVLSSILVAALLGVLLLPPPPCHDNLVLLLDIVGANQLLCEYAVVTENQQTAGIEVKASERREPLGPALGGNGGAHTLGHTLREG